jgi:hypothetical protein
MVFMEQCFWDWIDEWYRYWEWQCRMSDVVVTNCVYPLPTGARRRQVPTHLRLVVDNTAR